MSPEALARRKVANFLAGKNLNQFLDDLKQSSAIQEKIRGEVEKIREILAKSHLQVKFSTKIAKKIKEKSSLQSRRKQKFPEKIKTPQSEAENVRKINFQV